MSGILDLISKLREQWFNLILIMGLNEDFISKEECLFEQNSFYSVFMCSNTASFLWYLFFNKKITINNDQKTTNLNTKNILKNILKPSKNINVYYCSLDAIGNNETILFPEHIWLILQIENRFYILQSFYCAYTINTDFGFFELEDPESYFKMLEDILYMCDHTDYSPKLAKKYVEMFNFYTNIDINRFWGNTDYKPPGEYKFQITKQTITNEEKFIKQVNDKICRNVNILNKDENITKEYDLELYSAYNNKHLNLEDTKDENHFLNMLSELSGFETKNLNLITIEHLKKITYYTFSKKDLDLSAINMKFKISYNTRDIIENDIEKSFNCN